MNSPIVARNMQTSTKHNQAELTLPRKRSTNWTSVRLLNIYRLGLAAIFFSQAFVEHSPLLNIVDLRLYSWVSFAFLVLALVWMLAAWIERRGFESQVSLQIYSDSIIIILLMHACGGISSGLGMLLMISIATTVLLTQQSLAILFAALASLGLLAEHVFSAFYVPGYSGTSTQVGILGASLIATAIVTHKLTMRLRSTEQLIRQREKDVALLSALNQQIIDNLQAGVILLDPDNQIKHINQAAIQLLKLQGSNAEALARDCPKLLALIETWQETPELEKHYLPAESGLDNIQVSIQQLESQGQTNTMVFVNDVTSIRNSMQQAKLASLGHLTASIAHEIRNPLGAISYAAELLRENEDIDESDRRMVEIINQHTLRINHIIEDVLNISRGSSTVQDTVDLAEWINSFITEFCQSGLAKPENFKFENALGNVQIHFDSGHLNQIFTNLCSNARIHGDSDLPIIIRMFASPGAPICVEIADQGPGISNDKLDKIFEPFYTTSHQGSGLGLYIVSQLCELNNAAISAQLNQYNGTSFTLQMSTTNIQAS